MKGTERACALFLLGFALALPILALSSLALFQLTVPSEAGVQTITSFEIDARLARSLPTDWVDPQITRADQLRESRLFWSNHPNSAQGVALRVLQTPALFRSVFPGYPDAMRRDELLWRDYFHNAFGTEVFADALDSRRPSDNAPSTGTTVVVSGVSCLEIFRRYGADVVVFGASETYRAINPSLLSPALGVHARVLVCAGSTPDIISTLARDLARNAPQAGDKPAWAIWGVSPWAFRSHDPDVRDHWRARARELLDATSPLGNIALRLLLWHSAVASWDNLYEPSFQRVLGRIEERIAPAEDSGVNVGARPYPFLKHVSTEECGFSQGREALDETLEALLAFARKAYLYVPPTTPLQTTGTPSCFYENARKLVASRGGERVAVETADWRAYGLDYRHFVDGQGKIDVNHVNYSGSILVTDRIARRLVVEGGIPRP